MIGVQEDTTESAAAARGATIDYALIAIVALGAAVRFWGLEFGFPHAHARPDELPVNGIALNILRGDLNPHFFDYPSLYFYVLAALDVLYFLWGRAAGWFTSFDAFLASWATHWTAFFLLARVVSATAGTVTIAVVYRVGVRLFDRLSGVLGAFFLALAFLHVRDSHFGVTDVSMTLFVALSFLLLVRAFFEPRLRWFALAGVAAGIGASLKYNAALMAAPAVAAAAMSRRPALDRALLFAAFALCGAGAFVAGSPFALLDRAQFLHDVAGVSKHLATVHGVDLGPGGIYHLTFSLRYGVGIPLLAAAFGGAALLVARDWRKSALFLSFPFAYYLAVLTSRTVFVRYAIPFVPFACLSAAVLVAALASAAERTRVVRAAPLAAVLAAVLAVLLVAPSALSVYQIDRLFGTADNRRVVAEWVRANVPPGSSIYLGGSVVARPMIELGPGVLYHYFDHFQDRRFSDNRVPVSGIPDWLVLPESTLAEFCYVPPEVQQLARERYDLVAAFKAMDLDGNIFDRQDAFLYPYAGFNHVRRGGPNYYVYARNAVDSR